MDTTQDKATMILKQHMITKMVIMANIYLALLLCLSDCSVPSGLLTERYLGRKLENEQKKSVNVQKCYFLTLTFSVMLRSSKLTFYILKIIKKP